MIAGSKRTLPLPVLTLSARIYLRSGSLHENEEIKKYISSVINSPLSLYSQSLVLITPDILGTNAANFKTFFVIVSCDRIITSHLSIVSSARIPWIFGSIILSFSFPPFFRSLSPSRYPREGNEPLGRDPLPPGS